MNTTNKSSNCKPGGVAAQAQAARSTRPWDDEDFQDQLAALLVSDAEFLKAHAPLLDAEDFKPMRGTRNGVERQIVAEQALVYFEKHQEPIGRQIRFHALQYANGLNLGSAKIKQLEDYIQLLQQLRPVPAAIAEQVVEFKSGRLKAIAAQELVERLAAGPLSDEEWIEISERPLATSGREPQKSLLDAPQWPLRPEWESPAYHGIAGEIVRAIDPLTEADPVAVLVQILAGFGCMIGHRPYLTLDADEHHTNVHLCLVGNTGEGRKGTALTRAKQVLAWIDHLFVQHRCFGGVASGQAMMKEVCDDLYRKDKDGNQYLAQQGAEDKRWLMTEPEFGRTLTMCRSENSILSHVIREGFDSGNLRNTAMGNPLCATGAHISLVGHITPGELSSLLRNTTLHLNGFCNRILFLCCVKSKELRRGGQRTVPGWEEFQKRLRRAYVWARRVDRVVWSQNALDLWSTAGYDEVTRVHGNVLDEVTNRGNSIVPRLASIQALLNRSGWPDHPGYAVIRPAHLEAALELWRYSVSSARYIFGSAATLDPDGRKVLEVLQECGSASRSELARKAFQNNYTRPRLEAALALLQRKGLVRADGVKTDGRDREVWSRVGR